MKKIAGVIMPHCSPSTNLQPLPSSPTPYSHAELAKRIERFQQAAQDLFAMYERAEQNRDGDSHSSATQANGETRCYHLSPDTVQHERELLRRYHAKDFCGLLAEAHMLLAGLVKMMKSTHHDVRVKGHVIASLGCLLEQVSALVLRMRNVYGRMEKVGP